MAAAPGDSAQSLQEELTCCICLDAYRDPVMIVGCGHNFCRPCITQCWGASMRNVSCPQCRKTFSHARLQPNRAVKNVVELMRQTAAAGKPLPAAACPAPSEEDLCPVHGKPLKLFCQKDQVPICGSCGGSQDHRGHKVVPIGKAAQEQKQLIQKRLEQLKKQKAISEKSKEGDKKQIRLMQDEGLQGQTVVAEIESFCQFLKNQAEFLLPHLEVLQSDLSKKEQEISGRFTGQIDQLNSYICNVEKTCEQPGGKLLKEAARLNEILSKGEQLCSDMKREDSQEYQTAYSYTHWKDQYLENSLGELESRFDQFVSINESVRKMLPRFRAEIESVLKNMKDEVLKPHEKVCVVLDDETANKFLLLSEDEKSATFTVETKRAVPSHPKRFDKVPCVLGREEISRGRFYWDVDVENGKTWAVGVARESVDRKSWVNFAPEKGIWAVGFDERYVAYTGPASTPLSLSTPLKTMEVNVDYTAGEVSFYNADDHHLIFSFPATRFNGEKIYPWFWISDGCLRMRWSMEDAYPDLDYLVSGGFIKPWEVHANIEKSFWGLDSD